MKWIFPPLQSEKIKEIQDKLDLPKQLVNILLQRKIDKPRLIKEFLSLDLSMLHDPFLMKGMNAAVERIIKNIKKKTPIFILGDYDVDGYPFTTERTCKVTGTVGSFDLKQKRALDKKIPCG